MDSAATRNSTSASVVCIPIPLVPKVVITVRSQKEQTKIIALGIKGAKIGCHIVGHKEVDIAISSPFREQRGRQRTTIDTAAGVTTRALFLFRHDNQEGLKASVMKEDLSTLYYKL